MGIYRKYDLTAFTHLDNPPMTYYDCDGYIVECYDYHIDWKYSFNTWKEAVDYCRGVFEDDTQIDVRVILWGLVYD